ncbi:hypothetical protein [Vibrio vulnificus YJ016]|uniref:Uncharacterized protein n=1 Tax=Vibrio vulnificus (strain YJ016) TaxID=196600 RepID=Q7MC31_VIBVY|nr:hypothetical protein [Vibrio vulnificus YJ016]
MKEKRAFRNNIDSGVGQKAAVSGRFLLLSSLNSGGLLRLLQFCFRFFHFREIKPKFFHGFFNQRRILHHLRHQHLQLLLR